MGNRGDYKQWKKGKRVGAVMTRNEVMASNQPSLKQIACLRSPGYKGSDPVTMSHASELIGKWENNVANGVVLRSKPAKQPAKPCLATSKIHSLASRKSRKQRRREERVRQAIALQRKARKGPRRTGDQLVGAGGEQAVNDFCENIGLYLLLNDDGRHWQVIRGLEMILEWWPENGRVAIKRNYQHKHQAASPEDVIGLLSSVLGVQDRSGHASSDKATAVMPLPCVKEPGLKSDLALQGAPMTRAETAGSSRAGIHHSRSHDQEESLTNPALSPGDNRNLMGTHQTLASLREAIAPYTSQ